MSLDQPLPHAFGHSLSAGSNLKLFQHDAYVSGRRAVRHSEYHPDLFVAPAVAKTFENNELPLC